VDYLNNPVLLKAEDLKEDIKVDHGGYQWFYEGRNGWWQYDERTSIELEEKFSKGEKVFELLIAGFLYVIDMDNMIQVRRNDPFRRRRIKRDLSNIERKGVAGLKIIPPEEREGAYGEEGGKSPPAMGANASGAQGQSSQGQNPRKSTAKTPDTRISAQALRNAPQTPSGSEASTPELDRDLSLQMETLNLDMSGLVSLDSTRSTDLERSADLEGSFAESLDDGDKSD
jgi:E3 ubiquitin-protein ligase RNF146